MSKFVTYGATETLDNDQKFIIDSDRTGPGSITAKDAASSLLSKWAGFDTFEEAVQNTISNNQEFIDRDTAIRNETAELKKKIVTTFPAKDASGAVATFESEFEDAPLKSCIVKVNPVQDLHGYDYPWPAGGWVNLLPAGAAGTFTNNGMTVVSDGKGNYHFYGTSTANSSVIVPIDEVTLPNTVFMHMLNASASGQCAFVLAYGATQFATPSMGTVNKIIDVSAGAGGKTINMLRFYINTGNTVDITLSPMLCADATARSFSPYENICPITGWTGCEVQRTGKNLLSVNTIEDVSWANDLITTQTTEHNISKIINSLDVGTYTISYTATVTSVNTQKYTSTTAKAIMGNMTIIASNGDHFRNNRVEINLEQALNHYSITNDLTIDVTANNKGKFTHCYIYGLGRDAATEGAPNGPLGLGEYSNLQLELGSTPTPYEPYKGRTYPITFPTEASTVYGGYIDPINGEIVADRCFLEGINWTEYKRNNGFVAYRAENVPSAYSNNLTSKPISNIISNFRNFNSDKMTQNIVQIVAFSTVVYMALSEEVDASQVQLSYKLAEPIHYSLTAIDIKTLLGTNNIWADTGDVEVEYLMSDVSWYVEKKLKAFQSVLAGVEDSAVASKNYSANTYLIFNDDIYRVTKAITAGETIEEGVNVTKTTVAEQLMALAQA